VLKRGVGQNFFNSGAAISCRKKDKSRKNIVAKKVKSKIVAYIILSVKSNGARAVGALRTGGTS
jgi:hypothetical protein